MEPWTEHLYARLRDAHAGVRKHALMVLSHLILNDMLKVGRFPPLRTTPVAALFPAAAPSSFSHPAAVVSCRAHTFAPLLLFFSLCAVAALGQGVRRRNGALRRG